MLREGLMQAVRFSTVSEGQSRRGQVDYERMRSKYFKYFKTQEH